MADGLPPGLAREASRGSGRTRPPGRVPAPSLRGACPVGEGPWPLGEGPCSPGGPCPPGGTLFSRGRHRGRAVALGAGHTRAGHGRLSRLSHLRPTQGGRGPRRGRGWWQGRKVLALVGLQHVSGRSRCPLVDLVDVQRPDLDRARIGSGPAARSARRTARSPVVSVSCSDHLWQRQLLRLLRRNWHDQLNGHLVGEKSAPGREHASTYVWPTSVWPTSVWPTSVWPASFTRVDLTRHGCTRSQLDQPGVEQLVRHRDWRVPLVWYAS